MKETLKDFEVRSRGSREDFEAGRPRGQGSQECFEVAWKEGRRIGWKEGFEAGWQKGLAEAKQSGLQSNTIYRPIIHPQ